MGLFERGLGLYASRLRRQGRERCIYKNADGTRDGADDGKGVYLARYYVFPRRPRSQTGSRFPVSVMLHNICMSDVDRDPHDHPFSFLSAILVGSYNEERHEWVRGRLTPKIVRRRRFSVGWRKAEWLHRVRLMNETPVWTLVIAGPRRREWGYQIGNGWDEWVEWKEYLG